MVEQQHVVEQPVRVESRYTAARLPITAINVLDQPRKTFENIDSLALDIAQKGLLHPLIVAQLDEMGMRDYIDNVNNVWNTNHVADEMNPSEQDGIYYVLLAGERRFRACKHLMTEGCSLCQEEYGEGSCYARHMGDESVDVRLIDNPSTFQALFIQASENIHMRVPPQEEAHFYDRLYKALLQQDPKYSVARFARDVGRRPETIRGALKYCTLPEDIQSLVEGGVIAYGIAGEIARLRNELHLSEPELEYWTMSAVVHNYKVPDFREMVTNHIKQQKSGQSMLEMFTENQEAEMKRQSIRKTVEREMVQDLWQGVTYWSKVLHLFESGQLGAQDSPFSHGSPLRILSAQIAVQRRLIPHLQGIIQDSELRDTADTLLRVEELVQIASRFQDAELITVMPASIH